MNPSNLASGKKWSHVQTTSFGQPIFTINEPWYCFPETEVIMFLLQNWSSIWGHSCLKMIRLCLVRTKKWVLPLAVFQVRLHCQTAWWGNLNWKRRSQISIQEESGLNCENEKILYTPSISIKSSLFSLKLCMTEKDIQQFRFVKKRNADL